MKIVHRIDDGIDRREVLCTTYQMRNCFKQFADGVASELDVHCYFQHAFAAELCPKNGRVLDMCCGRGLLIPFLRYSAKAKCSLYVGVDIHPKNAVWVEGRDPRRPNEEKCDWGFDVRFVESNVDAMVSALRNDGLNVFDLIVYTSAIEHMQPTSQFESLKQAREVVARNGLMYLSCPITEKGRDGYQTQFKAHVYEPRRNELLDWLDESGWEVERSIGLSTSCARFRAGLTGKELSGAEYIYSIMPRSQALPTIAALYPRIAAEMAFICRPA